MNEMNTVFVKKRTSAEIVKTYRNITMTCIMLQGLILSLGMGGDDKLMTTLIFNQIIFIGFTIVYTELIGRNKKESAYGRAFDALKMKRKVYIYTLGAATILMPTVEIFSNLSLFAYGTVCLTLMMAYFVYLFNSVEKIERKIEELRKEEETIFDDLFEDFVCIEESEPKTLIDEKKEEVLSVLNEIKEKLEATTDFVSIEKKRLINEVYAADVERKMNVLNRMSESQKAKEQNRVLDYFDKVIKEAKELI